MHQSISVAALSAIIGTYLCNVETGSLIPHRRHERLQRRPFLCLFLEILVDGPILAFLCLFLGHFLGILRNRNGLFCRKMIHIRFLAPFLFHFLLFLLGLVGQH